jgi:hypothetical protein
MEDMRLPRCDRPSRTPLGPLPAKASGHEDRHVKIQNRSRSKTTGLGRSRQSSGEIHPQPSLSISPSPSTPAMRGAISSGSTRAQRSGIMGPFTAHRGRQRALLRVVQAFFDGKLISREETPMAELLGTGTQVRGVEDRVEDRMAPTSGRR